MPFDSFRGIPITSDLRDCTRDCEIKAGVRPAKISLDLINLKISCQRPYPASLRGEMIAPSARLTNAADVQATRHFEHDRDKVASDQLQRSHRGH